jgi:hypothetical protein
MESKMKPELSLVTSFSLNGSAATMKNWPNGITNADLYAFMQRDVEYFFPEATHAGYSNALAALAYGHLNPDTIEFAADRIVEIYENVDVVAFASFLPEIMAHEWKKSWYGWMSKMAQDAIMGLIDLARALRRRKQTAAVIEVACGTRIDGVWRAKLSDGPGFVANRLDQTSAIRRLITRLIPVAEYAARDPVINLAVEMEPGPLSTIGDWGSLSEFCGEVSVGTPEMKRVVGVNLNISHWAFLAGVMPDRVLSPGNKHILERIAHCQLCDHDRGDFGDAVAGTFHDENDFRGWFAVIADKMGQKHRDDAPDFSGYIACELEACKRIVWLREFLDDCSKWLSNTSVGGVNSGNTDLQLAEGRGTSPL